MTVYAIPRCHKTPHTVSSAVDREASPAIDGERRQRENSLFSARYGGKSAVVGGFWVGANYSHSIVPGGFDVTS